MHPALEQSGKRLTIRDNEDGRSLGDWLLENLPYKYEIQIPARRGQLTDDELIPFLEWLEPNVHHSYFIGRLISGQALIFFADFRDATFARLNFDFEEVVFPFHANRHPIIGVQDFDPIFILQTHFVPGQNGPTIRIIKQSNKEALPFATFEAAEKHVIQQYLEKAVVTNLSRDTGKSLWLELMRCNNLIASDTNRGSGNTILLNPTDVEVLITSRADLPDTMMHYSCFNEYALDWKYEGQLVTSMIYSRSDIPQGKLLLFYSGSNEMDRPAVIQQLNGQSNLFLNKDFLHYGRVISLE